jgi:hypothetical protein
VNWYETRTPAQWATEAQRLRAEAAASARRSAESWERSDTDGYLSQWASNSMARRYRMCAELCDNHGLAEHTALFDLDGNLVSTRKVDGPYGWSWLTTDAHVNAGGRRFVKPSKARDPQTRYDNLRKKGYTLGTIRVRSGVFPRSGGIQVIDCIEALKDATPEIVRADNGPTQD